MCPLTRTALLPHPSCSDQPCSLPPKPSSSGLLHSAPPSSSYHTHNHLGPTGKLRLQNCAYKRCRSDLKAKASQLGGAPWVRHLLWVHAEPVSRVCKVMPISAVYMSRNRCLASAAWLQQFAFPTLLMSDVSLPRPASSAPATCCVSPGQGRVLSTRDSSGRPVGAGQGPHPHCGLWAPRGGLCRAAGHGSEAAPLVLPGVLGCMLTRLLVCLPLVMA
jgi:hypothetical protein